MKHSVNIGYAYDQYEDSACPPEELVLMAARSRPSRSMAGESYCHQRSTARTWGLGWHCHMGSVLFLGCLFFLLSGCETQDVYQAVGCPHTTKTQVQCPAIKETLAPKGLASIIGQGVLDVDLDPQQVPCKPRQRICYQSAVDDSIQCTPGNEIQGRVDDEQSNTKLALMEIQPGGKTVCGHGNREFSFFVQVESLAHTKALVVFMNGGICYGADCKTTMSLNIDNMVVKAGVSTKERSPSSPTFLKTILGQKLDSGIFQDFDESWAIWLIPDCTGDDHIGNRSKTYDENEDTCFTAHHKGGVNTGTAIDYMLDNLKGLQQVVLLNSGYNPRKKWSTGFGGVGAAYSYWFWANYIQKRLPSASVRTILDSAMGLYGPMWHEIHRNDPWGASNLMVPDANERHGNDKFLLPPKDEWSLADDDMTAYYRWAVEKSPSLAFADVSSVDDAVQIAGFVQTGGKPEGEDCCLEGCGCSGTPRYGWRGGKMDWTKTRKVQTLQRLKYLPNNYRVWLRSGGKSGDLRFLVSLVWPRLDPPEVDALARINFCPIIPLGGFACPEAYKLRKWINNFINVRVIRDGTGLTLGNTFISKSYEDRAFGLSICEGCLNGIPGSSTEMGESCNATFYPGENLYTVAAKYHTDWMALWSLNGNDAPDTQNQRGSYRFAHEYIMQEGDTLQSVASRFQTTVNALIGLNFNCISHISNPARLTEGDRICIVPDFAKNKDRFGTPICDAEGPHPMMEGTI